jgi:hypothetical protein
MDKILLEASIVEKLHYLHKHLFDNPLENPTNVPKIGPNGKEIVKIGQIANILGVNRKIAAHYVLQDPNASKELKIDAKEVLEPGIYISADDSYLPVLHQAYSILNKPLNTQKKGIRLVRTTNGVRRYRQKQGTIIIRDGESPLDALTALPNDVPGYEKLSDKDGNVYYIGNENGSWVVRDPKNNTIVFAGESEEESFTWLNREVGGKARSSSKEKDKPAGGATGTGSRTERGEDVVANININEATQLLGLTDDELDLYRRLIQRGLNHSQALSLAHRSVSVARSSGKKPK